MYNVHTEETTIAAFGGHIYAKSWDPVPSHAPPLVLLHDSLGSVAQWRDFPALLATTLARKVIAYDRLGFGQSSARQPLPSSLFISEESTLYFPTIKQALGIQEYALLGHSVGGAMALNIAADDKDCVAVITIAAQAFVEPQTIAGIEQAKAAFSNPEQLQKLERWHGDKAPWVLNAWVERWLSAEFQTWSLENCISRVICPVLAIHGENDEYGSNAFPDYITNHAGGVAQQSILPDCGHMPHKEKTAEVIALVENFLHLK